MSVGENIKIYRKEKNLTQGQLAELIGVSTQAVSKWETGAGMPDISQVVPLARVLKISTDKLLGHTDEAFEKEAAEIRNRCGGINFITDIGRAENLYDLSAKFFEKHSDVPDIALVCLECFVELYSKKCISLDAEAFMEESQRYANSIFRYETDPDRVCKTYYLMSRAYDLGEEKNKSRDMLKKIPYIFGDRDYWEAEVAYTDGKDVLMFPVGDEDGSEKATKERIHARVERAQAILNNV